MSQLKHCGLLPLLQLLFLSPLLQFTHSFNVGNNRLCLDYSTFSGRRNNPDQSVASRNSRYYESITRSSIVKYCKSNTALYAKKEKKHDGASATTTKSAECGNTNIDIDNRKSSTPPPSRNRRSSNIAASSLQQWARQVNIGVSSAIEIEYNSDSGLGWKAGAASNSSDNQVLLQVPTSVVLQVNSKQVPRQADLRNIVSSSNSNSNGDDLWKKLPWYAQMSLYINALVQNNGRLPTTSRNNSDSNNSDSNNPSRQVWLDSLPPLGSMTTPIHWTSEQQQALDYKPLQDAVQKQQKSWEELYQTIKGYKLNGINNFSYDTFVWGCEMARSRAFSGSTTAAFDPKIYIFTLFLVTLYVGFNLGTIEQAANGAGVVFSVSILKDFVWPKLSAKKSSNSDDDNDGNINYVICPLVDLTNHNTMRANAKVAFEYFGNAYSLSSTGAIGANEPILMSYGPRSNDQLLQYYGFVEVGNPNDVYVLPPLREWDLDDIEKATGRQIPAGRLQQLDKAGVLGEASGSGKTTGIVVTRVSGLDPAWWPIIRALIATDQEWQEAGQLVNGFVQASDESNDNNKSSSSNELAARTAVRTILEKELESKTTTLQQDQTMLQRMGASKSMDSSVEEKLAVMFRIEKKQLLREQIDKLK